MSVGDSESIGVKGCADVVTVWNRHYNKESGKDEFFRHVIPVLCRWRSSERRGETRGSMQSAVASVSQNLTVIVPYTEKYRPYDEWKNLDDDGKRRFFTLHITDLIALGEHFAEITGTDPFTEAKVKKELGERCATVSAFADNSGDGKRKGGHYKVGCFYGFRSRF